MTAGVNSNGSADLSEPLEEEARFADATPVDHLGNSIINDLVAVSMNKNRLRMHILKRANEFRATDLLQALQAGSYPWLSDALLLLDADTTMDNNTMVGLMLAMTAQGGIVAEHLGDFVEDLDDSARDILLGSYKAELQKLYRDKEVCKWMSEHVALISQNFLDLAQLICDHKTKDAY